MVALQLGVQLCQLLQFAFLQVRVQICQPLQLAFLQGSSAQLVVGGHAVNSYCLAKHIGHYTRKRVARMRKATGSKHAAATFDRITTQISCAVATCSGPDKHSGHTVAGLGLDLRSTGAMHSTMPPKTQNLPARSQAASSTPQSPVNLRRATVQSACSASEGVGSHEGL